MLAAARGLPCWRAAAGARLLSANADAARSVVSLLTSRDPSALALVAPAQNLRWSYGELAARVEAVAATLQQDGARTVGVALGSVGENVAAQLGAVVAGVDVATVKLGTDVEANAAAFQAAADSLGCRKVFVGVNDAVQYGEVSGIAGVVLAEPEAAAAAGGGGGGGSTYYYNSVTKGVGLAELLALGQATAAELRLGPDDRVCVPVTLNHAMGFGFGVLGALSAGAAIVLPSPSPDALFTLAALKSEGATVLLADSHTAASLDALSLGGGVAPVAGLAALRAGLIKVGSGEAFGLGEPRDCLGVGLTTVGKPPVPK
jgi:acyl-CoA synthetase (AMP-forming)/AMP-acid ligase II